MKRYFRLAAAFVALAALLVPAVVLAQQTESRIVGRVLDDSRGGDAGSHRHRHIETDRRR